MTEIFTHLHPMVVHFPIALILTALFLQLIGSILNNESFKKSAVIIFVIAAVFSPMVVKTGFWEEERLGIHHPLLESHEKAALVTMWICLFSLPCLWIVQRKMKNFFNVIFIVVLLAAASAVSLTAFRGGKMVYEYGVGVDK